MLTNTRLATCLSGLGMPAPGLCPTRQTYALCLTRSDIMSLIRHGGSYIINYIRNTSISCLARLCTLKAGQTFNQTETTQPEAFYATRETARRLPTDPAGAEAGLTFKLYISTSLTHPLSLFFFHFSFSQFSQKYFPQFFQNSFASFFKLCQRDAGTAYALTQNVHILPRMVIP